MLGSSFRRWPWAQGSVLHRGSSCSVALHSRSAPAEEHKAGSATPQRAFKDDVGPARQAVHWDAVAMSPEAKALLQKHAVKAGTALKMHKILGFEDLDDIRHLSPALVSRLKLKPLQLAPLLSMLRDKDCFQPPQLPTPATPPGITDVNHLSEEEQRRKAELELKRYQWVFQVQRRQLEQQQEEQQQQQQLQQQQQNFTDAQDRPLAELAGGADPVDRMQLTTADEGQLDSLPDCKPTHTCVAVLEGHSARVRSVAVTPDGRHAVSSSRDGTLRLWDLETQDGLVLKGHKGTICCVAVTPDGRHAVAGGSDRKLHIYDLASQTHIASMEGHSDWVWAVAVTPDGRYAVSGCSDRQLRLWDLQSRSCIGVMEGHTGDVLSVAISADGRRALSGGDECSLRVWDLEAQACVATLGGQTEDALPDGRRTMHAGDEDSDGPAPAPDLVGAPGGHSEWVTSVAITPDGRHAVSGGYDNTLLVWDLDTFSCVGELEGHDEAICFVTITPDGQHAVSGSSDRKLLVHHLESHSCVASLKGHAHCVWSVAITADGSRAVSGGDDNALRVWDLSKC